MDKFMKMCSRWPYALVMLVLLSAPALAVEPACSDMKAKSASDEKALSYFQSATIFHPAKVFKRHNFKGEKEVGSYVEVNDGRKYSIFTLVTNDCQAYFIKRTRQND